MTTSTGLIDDQMRYFSCIRNCRICRTETMVTVCLSPSIVDAECPNPLPVFTSSIDFDRASFVFMLFHGIQPGNYLGGLVRNTVELFCLRLFDVRLTSGSIQRPRNHSGMRTRKYWTQALRKFKP